MEHDSWQARVQPVLTATMRDKVVPGIVLAVARGIRPPEFVAVGTDAVGDTLAADTRFPVASITKLATALAVLRLVATGAIALDDRLDALLPDARAAGNGITVRMLLSHTGGLPGDLTPQAVSYTPLLTWPVLAAACLAAPATRPPQSRVTYSNVGIGLLAVIVERRTGLSFADALTDLVLDPLAITGYLGAESPQPPARIAGDFGEHRGTPLEPINSRFWRSLALPWGGLITDAASALRLVSAFSGTPSGFLPTALVAEATRSQTDGLGGGFFPPLVWPSCPWGLGVEVRGEKDPHWTPRQVSSTSFGHVGSTGCLAWADPDAHLAWVMIGTRNFLSWWDAWPAIGDALLPRRR